MLSRLPDVVQEPLFDIGGTSVTVATLIVFVFVVAATFVVSALAQRGVVRFLAFRRISQEGTVAIARRFTHYFTILVGLGIALQIIGIKLTTLFAAGAVFAIGFGFAMQNIAQNFVSGLILLVERIIKPGDVLEVDGRFVRVRQMGIRSTIARTLDDEEIIVPNSTIVQSTVKNFTMHDSHYRLRNAVGVTYDSDMALVRRTLEEVARRIPWRLQENDPVVYMAEFGDSAVIFEVSVWVDDPWRSRRARSDLNEAIWWALKDAGITIAYPQMDLHLDGEVVRALGRG